ncbi:MAG: hypothetical protein HWE22_03060 [Flavobacteriales bacterium]|nr:hypothetical protein [Flavobacteriales bacterium]
MRSKKNMQDEDAEFGVDSRYASYQAQKADGQKLMEARLERMKNVSEEDVKRARLMQLKLQIEDYLEKPTCSKQNFFTNFLSSYIDTIYTKRSSFANDIDITPVRLSQVLNNHREPHEEFMLRLMVHSEKAFQGVCDFPQKTWYQVYYQEKICDTLLREDEWKPRAEKHVKLRYDKKKK